MNEKPNYYAILPANVRYDADLSPNAKLLYAEITSLAYKDGYCWATNNYFMDLYSASLASIKRWLKELKDKGYIDVCVNYIKGTKEVESRYITLTEGVSPNLSRGGLKNEPRGGLKNEPDNIINKNIILEHKEKLNKKKFTPPTVDEVKAYCDERNNGIDAEYFVSYYKSKGWVVGKSPMKDWKSAVITWEKRNKNNTVKDMNDVPTITYDDTNNPVF